MRVPFLDLARLHGSIRAELDEAFDRVVRSSAFVLGNEVARFEDLFATAHRAPAAAGCASGTDALTLALRALGVGEGDEVVVPAMTFAATAEAVVHAGATPVIADVDPDTLLLASEGVAAVRGPRTTAVVPVHLYGHVVPFDLLREWADSGLWVVEDAAQAHLASWRGEPVGSAGHAACFSFYPGKNLGALGDGGIVTSRDPALVDRVRRLRDHGRAEKYTHDEIGWSSRLDGLQAAFLQVKLGHLGTWTEARRRLAARYREGMEAMSDLGVDLVPWTDGAVHHLLVARARRAPRDRLRHDLEALRIHTGVHYPVPLSRQPALAPWQRPCPAAEAAAEEVVSLPMDPLMTEDSVDLVVSALRMAILGQARRPVTPAVG